MSDIHPLKETNERLLELGCLLGSLEDTLNNDGKITIDNYQLSGTFGLLKDAALDA